MARSGLGIALSWEKPSISLLPGWLLQGEETSWPREVFSEPGFCAQQSSAFLEHAADTNLSFGVDRARDVRHSCITGCHRYTSAVSMRAIATGLLKRGC